MSDEFVGRGKKKTEKKKTEKKKGGRKKEIRQRKKVKLLWLAVKGKHFTNARCMIADQCRCLFYFNNLHTVINWVSLK